MEKEMMISAKEMEKDLVVRLIRPEDVEEIAKMAGIAFGDPRIAFTPEQYKSHIATFPEGQICIEYKGKVVGSCSSVIVNFDEYGEDHTFLEISGGLYITNHNPEGKNLYGIDVVVDPNYRQLKLGRRLYQARRKLCRDLNLESILIGGRIPGYHKYANELTPLEYVHKVERQELYDPIMTFQLRNGFELLTVMPGYLIYDKKSLKNATLMEWKNSNHHK